MSNAERLFNDLGYVKVDNPPFADWIMYREKDINYGRLREEIVFNKTHMNCVVNTTINLELAKAITKQLEEMK